MRFRTILAGVLCAALGTPTLAAVTATPVFVQTPKAAKIQFLNASVAGTYVALYTGGANGSKITGLYAASSDGTAAHVVTCGIQNTSVNYGGSAVNVPLNSGFANAVPAVNLMSATNWPGLPLDSDGNPFIYLTSASDILVCTFATTVTSGAANTLNVIAIGADF